MADNDKYSSLTEKLLDNGAATNGQPTAGSEAPGKFIRKGCETANIYVTGSAAGGTFNVTIRLWGYVPSVADWYPLSIGTGVGDTTNKSGWLNGGNPIDAIDTNEIKHYEVVGNLKHFSKLYAQVVAISGTTPSIDVDVEFQTPLR
jgi:hypothetical protein